MAAGQVFFSHRKRTPHGPPPHKPPKAVAKAKAPQLSMGEISKRMARIEKIRKSSGYQASHKQSEKAFRESFSPHQRKNVKGFKVNKPKQRPVGVMSLGQGVVEGFKGAIGAEKQLAQAAYYWPGGVVKTVDALQKAARGNPDDIKALGKAQYKEFLREIHDPKHNIGNLSLYAYAAASGGAGAATRVGAKSLRLPAPKLTELVKPENPSNLQFSRLLKVTRTQPDNPLLRKGHDIMTARHNRVLQIPEEKRKGVDRLYSPEGIMARRLRSEGRLSEDVGGLKPEQYVNQKIANIGHKEPKHADMVPLRIKRSSDGTVTVSRAKTHDGDPWTRDDTIRTIRDRIPSEPDIRWVSNKLAIKAMAGPAHPLTKTLSAIVEPFRFAQVYARPAFTVNNHAQMIVQGVSEHGPRFFPYYSKAMRKIHGPEIDKWANDVMGTTRTESFQPVGLGQSRYRVLRKMKAGEQKIINLQNRATDLVPRKAMLYARAADRGYTKTSDLERLRNPKTAQEIKDRNSIVDAAKEDSFKFDAMSPNERGMAAVIYFYPYLKAAHRWSGRYVAQHPIVSSAGAQLGEIGEREQMGALGPVPGWLKGYIATKFGVVNPNALNTFATPAQTFEPFTGGGLKGSGELSIFQQFGTPPVQALSNPLTLPQTIGRQLGSTVVGSALKRAGVDYPQLLGPQRKTWKSREGKGRIADTAMPWMVGGLYPRHVKKEEVKKQGARGKKRKPVNRGGSGGTQSYFGGNTGGRSYFNP